MKQPTKTQYNKSKGKGIKVITDYIPPLSNVRVPCDIFLIAYLPALLSIIPLLVMVVGLYFFGLMYSNNL